MARILMVEDDRLFAEALARILGREGHEVFVAADAASGVELGESVGPDLIVADWMLRSQDRGSEVCRRIRAVHPWVRTILMTGFREVVLRSRLDDQDVDEVIEKPFHAEEILRAVRRLTPEGELVANG